MEEDLLEMAN
uniref:Uncharacterized protein n=1 Tax=Arundo donax TaxID=35708 RepID=A0A0A8Y652_ARUDO